MGLNRFVIHTSVHQPLVVDKKPGISLGPFGQWFTRNETWAQQAKPWLTYLTRNCYLLQQGRFVADVVYFYGEDSNLTALFLHKGPDVPVGYNFDYVNADALLHVLTFKDGSLATPSGMRYRVLALDPYSRHMSLPVLLKIRDLVQAGAIVSGPKPINTPSLSDDSAEFLRVADQLWGSGSGNSLGKGRVYGDQKLGEVLVALRVLPDFDHTKTPSGSDVLFIHRKLNEGDVYYVDSRSEQPASFDATFRVDGKEAELWHADTGKIEPASYKIEGGRTTVPLQLEPWGTILVVFRKPAKSSSRTLPQTTESTVATVNGPWEVTFQPDRGAPPKITMDRLSSWSDSSDEGVKYFSGEGTYTKTLQAPANWFKSGNRLWIDLGAVKDLAEVSLNGKPLGILWKPPFRAEVTGVLKPGPNKLEIEVTSLWANRIIGDRQPNATKQYTFTSPKFYKASSPLVPSGLLGPVQVIRLETR
jgi:hypothetical protein